MPRLNLTHPVDPTSPLNRGLVAWFLSLPQWSRGRTWHELCRRGNGTLTNGPVWQNRPGGPGSLAFDGLDDFVTAGTTVPAFGTGGSFTVAYWLYVDAAMAGDAAAVSRWNGSRGWIGYYIGASDQPKLYCFNGTQNVTVTWPTSLTRGVWHHVLNYCDVVAGTVGVAVDGAPATTSSGANGADDSGIALRLGASADSASFLNGRLDDVRLWARALSAAEASAVYSDSRVGYHGTLRRWQPPRRAPLPPTAGFTGVPLSGFGPLSVVFTDTSLNAPASWSWEKNDGSGWVPFAGTPTAPNPTEVFAAGTWSIRLTVANGSGSDTLTRTGYITVAPYGTVCGTVSAANYVSGTLLAEDC